jgi:amino acid adenylation domain-containing protein
MSSLDMLMAVRRALGAAAPEGCLHEAFEAQASERPAAIAVVDGDRHLSYGAVDSRANRVAAAVQLVAPPGRAIGLCVPRSAELIIGLIGILKAGCAYVPLDPDYPEARLSFIRGHADLAAVVTTRALRDRGAAGDRPAIVIDEDKASARRDDDAPQPPPRPRVDPGQPAYVIYTSGSSGLPKGVVVPHRNVWRLLAGTAEAFEFSGDDVWSLFHSSAFDFSVWEIWGALAHGARLVVIPHRVSRAPEACAALLAREQVTVLSQTPSAVRQFSSVAAPPALRWIVFGGETLEFACLASWFARHGDAQPTLVNMYGITETTVHVTHRVVRREDVTHGSRIGSRIGRGIPGWQVYLMDQHLQPAPIGMVGEICVGGAGLAQGYLNDPALTALRFVPNPFGTHGERLYRSGDLARAEAPDDLAYEGRRDTQVKLRGFRIELGEIEASIETHAAVANAVVAVREAASGVKLLAAYVVIERGADVTFPALRAHAASRLPVHMIPDTWTTIDRLPLTANGKLDRESLPAPRLEEE